MHIMRKSTRKFTFQAVFLGFIVFAVTGCSKTGTSTSTSPVTYLSLINASAYANNVTVYFNDTLATTSSGIEPGQYSERYGTIKPGSYGMQFESAGSDSVLCTLPTSTFDTLNFYTVIVYTLPQTGAVAAMNILDDFTTLNSSQANYRFFNLSSTHPNVDVYFNSTIVQSSRTTADNATNNSLNGFQQINPSTYTVTIKKAGTDSTIVSSGNISLTNGNAYTIFLDGVDGSTTNPLEINVLQASY
jgi:hypothetical protein